MTNNNCIRTMLQNHGVKIYNPVESLFIAGGTINEDFIMVGNKKIGLSELKEEDIKIVPLLQKMGEIVEENVKNYKTDFYNYDIPILQKAKEGDIIYWYVRSSGTEMIDGKNIIVKESTSNTIAKYWYNQAIKVYKIVINKKGGDLKKINKASLKSYIQKNEVDYKNIVVNVVLKGGEVLKNYVISRQEMEEHGGVYNNICLILTLEGRREAIEKIKKIELVKYII